MREKPNIFRFATKELSQDAFIAWLVSWAHSDLAKENPALHEAGRRLIGALLEKAGYHQPNSYSTLEVELQEEKIDVLLLLNSDLVVLIEDKTDSNPHSRQLTRYREYVDKQYPSRKLIPIYFKTGTPTPSELRTVEDAQYCVFLRRDLLEVLSKVETDNEVFLQFREHLLAVDWKVGRFATAPPAEWQQNGYEWEGFFTELVSRVRDPGWSYVANPAGGFMGFWWHTCKWRGHDVYLQLENIKLCFKIEVTEKSERSGTRDAWYGHLMNTARSHDLPVKKPNRFGNGQWMTVAVCDDDYLIVTDGKVDLVKTVAVMRRAEELLDLAVTKGD